MTVEEFNTVGAHSWKCPPGIENIFVIAQGAGGGGGLTAYNSNAVIQASAGAATLPQLRMVKVTPNMTYTITIGAGGSGQTASKPATGGGATSLGTIATFQGGHRGDTSLDQIVIAGNTGYKIMGTTAPWRLRNIPLGKGVLNNPSGYHLTGDRGIPGSWEGSLTAPATFGTASKKAGNGGDATGYGGSGGASGRPQTPDAIRADRGGNGSGGRLLIAYSRYGRLVRDSFKSSSTWTAPSGVENILAIGCGAGQNGIWGGAPNPNLVGLAAMPTPIFLKTTPNQAYSVTIGDPAQRITNDTKPWNQAPGASSLGSLYSWNGSTGRVANNYTGNTDTNQLTIGYSDSGTFSSTRNPINWNKITMPYFDELPQLILHQPNIWCPHRPTFSIPRWSCFGASR